ncbi:MAG: YfhO family protein [Firmicutes bacterium]|nr:YfhO family protein [Bacillota bacterium]
MDALLYFYPLKLYYATSFWHHGFHWWLPYEFLGLPFLGTLQTGILYPLNWFYFFLPVKDIAYGFNWSLIVHYALAGFFTYLYVRLLGLRDIPAFLAGIVFGLSGFMMARQQTINMQNAGVWLPLLLYFYEKIRRDLKFRDALWAGIAAGVQQLAGHTQICVYTTFVLGLFTLFFVFYQDKGRKLRFLFLCALPVILGVLIALPQLAATTQLLDHSYYFHLSYSVIAGYSFPPLALPMMISPFLFGGGYSHIPQLNAAFFLEESGFIGVLPLVVSIWVFFRKIKESCQIRFWGITALSAFFLVLGKYNPLTKFFFHVPGVNLFRAPARNWFEFDFAAAVLFAYGMEDLIYRMNDRKKSGVQVASTMGGILLFVFLFLRLRDLYFLALSPYFPSIQIREFARFFYFSNPAFWIPMLFILCDLILVAALTLFTSLRKPAAVFLVLSVFAEAFSFAAFQQNQLLGISALEKFTKNPIFQFLEGHIGFNRYGLVESYSYQKILLWPIVNISDHLSEIDGYDPLIPDSLYRLTGMSNPTAPYWPWPVLLENNSILDLLNVKYLIFPPWIKPPVFLYGKELQANSSSRFLFYRKVFKWAGYSICENLNFLPRVFSIKNLEVAKNLKQIKKRILLLKFNPAEEAFVYPKTFSRIRRTRFSSGKVVITHYGTDRITVRTNFRRTGFVVFSDQYYPGWKAFIGGKRVPIYRIDGLLRGVMIPSGFHLVLFQYENSFLIEFSFLLSGFVCVFCFACIVFPFLRVKKR